MSTVIIPQGDSSIKGGRTGETPIISSAAFTTSGTAGPWPVDFFSSAEIQIAVTTVSGTLAVYVQKLLPDNVTYSDIGTTGTLQSAIFTTTGVFVFSFVNGGNSFITSQAAALTTSTVVVHFGNYWRINYVLAGSGPSSTFGVWGSFKK